MLNLIENIWSMVKASVKRDLSVRMEEILSFQQEELSMKEHCLQALESIMHSSLTTVNSRNCSQSNNNVAKHYTKAIQE